MPSRSSVALAYHVEIVIDDWNKILNVLQSLQNDKALVILLRGQQIRQSFFERVSYTMRIRFMDCLWSLVQPTIWFTRGNDGSCQSEGGKTPLLGIFPTDDLLRVSFSTIWLIRKGFTWGMMSSTNARDRLDIPNSNPTSARRMIPVLYSCNLNKNSECQSALSRYSIPFVACPHFWVDINLRPSHIPEKHTLSLRTSPRASWIFALRGPSWLRSKNFILWCPAGLWTSSTSWYSRFCPLRMMMTHSVEEAVNLPSRGS